MIMHIFRLIVALLLIYLPGYLLTLIMFRRVRGSERFAVSVGVTLAILIALFMILDMFSGNISGQAISPLTLLVTLVSVSLVLLGVGWLLRESRVPGA